MMRKPILARTDGYHPRARQRGTTTGNGPASSTLHRCADSIHNPQSAFQRARDAEFEALEKEIKIQWPT
jgi:hypothetical protein